MGGNSSDWRSFINGASFFTVRTISCFLLSAGSFSESSFAVYAMNAPDDVKCALMDVVKGVWDEVDSRSGCESRCLRSR